MGPASDWVSGAEEKGSGAVEGPGEGREACLTAGTEAASWKLCPYPDAPLHRHSHKGTGESQLSTGSDRFQTRPVGSGLSFSPLKLCT